MCLRCRAAAGLGAGLASWWLAAACGPGGSGPLDATGPPVEAALRSTPYAQLNAVIPPPPFEAGLRGELSAQATIIRYGDETALLSPFTDVDSVDRHADLPAQGAAETALPGWAMYCFEDLAPGALPALLTVTLRGAAPAYYVGVSDYSDRAWRWSRMPASLGDNSLPLAGAQCINPYGRMYCVIAAWDAPLTVSQLRLRCGLDLPPPANFAATEDQPDFIRLSWDDPAHSYDPDGEGPQAFRYDLLWLEVAENPAGPWDVHTALLPGTKEFRLDGSTGNPVPPLDQPRYFRLRLATLGPDGTYGPPGGAVRGLRHFGVPASVQASDGAYWDRVRVSWEAVTGAATYEVYCDVAADPADAAVVIGTTSNTQFDHFATEQSSIPAEGVEYHYWVVARSADGLTSKPSASDLGELIQEAPSLVQASDGDYASGILITWSPIVYAAQYDVWLGPGDDPNVSSGIVGTTSDTQFVCHALNRKNTLPKFDEKYSFWVVARGETGFQSTPSAPDLGHRVKAIPSGLSASQGTVDDAIQISWDPSPGAEGYWLRYNLLGKQYHYVFLDSAHEYLLNLNQYYSGVVFEFSVAVEVGCDREYLNFSDPVTGFSE